MTRDIMLSYWVVLVVSLVLVQAQDFLTAISQYPSLSNFTKLFYDNPGLANTVVGLEEGNNIIPEYREH
jgi:hypothetical protein